MHEALTLSEIRRSVAGREELLAEQRREIAAKLSDPKLALTSFDIDALTVITAKQLVLGGIVEYIDRQDSSVVEDDVIATIVRAVRQHVTKWKPNSTSVGHVELELHQHFYAMEVLEAIEGTGFSSI